MTIVLMNYGDVTDPKVADDRSDILKQIINNYVV